MCRYNRVIVSWTPTNKASREHVHGLTVDVQSFIVSFFLEKVGSKNLLFLLWYEGIFGTELSPLGLPLSNKSA